MNDWIKTKAIPSVKYFVKNSTAPYVWMAICVWLIGAWLAELSSEWAYVRSFPPFYREAAIYLLLIAIILIFRARLLGPSWFLFGVLLVSVWTMNIAHDGLHRVFWFLLLSLMLLAYFILEGVELAVTELRDKDPEAFEDPRIS